MKRIIAGLLILILVFSMTACAGDSVQVDITQVKNTILTELQVIDPLELPTAQLQDLYGISPEMVKTSACFITMGGAFPDEIIMVEAVDAAAAKEIAAKLDAKRIADAKVVLEKDASVMEKLEKIYFQ